MKNLFIIKVDYIVDSATMEAYLEAHRAFLESLMGVGVCVMSGPRVPRDGGIYILQAESAAEAGEIISGDPFFINKIADYTVIEFTPTKFRSETLRKSLEE